MAALKAIASAGARNPFLAVASSGLQADILVRLMRVLEWQGPVGSLWFLSDCGLLTADKQTINRLKSFSKRLLKIRNSVFLHIDHKALHDPQAPYRRANIKWRTDIEKAIESISEVVSGLFQKEHGRDFTPKMGVADFEEIFRRDLLPLKKG